MLFSLCFILKVSFIALVMDNTRSCQRLAWLILLVISELISVVCMTWYVQVCVVIEGRYLVEVRLNGYTNPTGKRRKSGTRTRCCDNFNATATVCSGSDLCDSYFIYCLRPFGDARQSPGPEGCSNETIEYRSTSLFNPDDGHLNFSQSTVLGLDNPQVFPGLRGPYQVSDLISL